MRYGLRGPNTGMPTACASFGHSVISAARTILSDEADMMLAGGADSAITNIGIEDLDVIVDPSSSLN